MSTGDHLPDEDDNEEEAALTADFFVHAAASRRSTSPRLAARRKPARKMPEPEPAAAEPPEEAPAAEPQASPVPEPREAEPVLPAPVDVEDDGSLPVYVSPVDSYDLAPPESVTQHQVTEDAAAQAPGGPAAQSGYPLDVPTAGPWSAPGLGLTPPAPAGPGYAYPPPAVPSPAPAPQTVPPQASPVPPARVTPPVERPGQDAPAEWGWRGGVRRITGGRVSMPTGAREAQYRADLVLVQRNLGLPRSIVFVNPKGGTATTTSTLMAARAFGVHRGGGVLAWDTNESAGTLALRAQQGLHPTTSRDLLANLGLFHQQEPAHPAVLEHFVRRQQEGCFDVLAADPGTDLTDPVGPIDGGGIDQLQRVLQLYYPLVLIDTGNDMHSSAWQRAVAGADLLVVTVAVRPDAANAAVSMLDGLERHVFGPELLRRRTVTVVADLDPDTNPSLREAMTRYFADRSASVCEIPYDPALARGDRIDHARVSERTHRAWLHACAAMAAAL